jgi:flagellar biosynthesis protein FlhB
MDVGLHAVTRMAREDTRWFVVGVVALSIVLFLALPLSALIVVDYMKMKAQFKAERKIDKQELREMKEQIKQLKEAQDG